MFVNLETYKAQQAIEIPPGIPEDALRARCRMARRGAESVDDDRELPKSDFPARDSRRIERLEFSDLAACGVQHWGSVADLAGYFDGPAVMIEEGGADRGRGQQAEIEVIFSGRNVHVLSLHFRCCVYTL